MRKIVLSVHTTLDGFVAGTNGEMDWIKVDDEMFGFVSKLTDAADTALYGRITYEMMESYWPTAANQPTATAHDMGHARWYNSAGKIVLSRTIENSPENKRTVINGDISTKIEKLKNEPGKNIIIFGSPSAAHSLMEYNLIDDYWLFVNPIILGQGIPLFAKIKNRIALQPVTQKVFACGVTALNYTVIKAG